jgi:thiamine biosynthesis protein ThiI
MAFPLYLDYSGGQMCRLAVNSAKKLAAIHPKLELLVLPYNRVYRALTEKATGGLACLLQTRAALRAAEAVAKQVGGDAIVTDEGLERITQQGLKNLHAIEVGCKLMVLRPLAGMNKGEVEQIARQAGVPKQRVRPIKRRPRLPKFTPQKIEEIQKIEKELGVDALIKAALPKLRVIKLRRSA